MSSSDSSRPVKDWGSPENDEAGQTGQAIKLNRAIVGGSDLEGFALVKASDLEAIKTTSRQAVIPGTPSQQKRKGRPLGSGSLAKLDEPLLNEMHRKITAGEATSIHAAARAVADKANGGGTYDSKVRRLEKRYIKKSDRNQF